jgi:N-acetylneuraminate synthase
MNLLPLSPTESDAQRVMAWRNDPLTLAMSFHQTPKRWESFYPEFLANYFPGPDLPAYWGLVEGLPVGLVRFRAYDDPLPGGQKPLCDISIMIAPEQRGRGYSKALILAGSAAVYALGWAWIVAEIKAQNTASIHAFEAAGYRYIDTYPRSFSDLPDPIPVRRYLATQKESRG